MNVHFLNNAIPVYFFDIPLKIVRRLQRILVINCQDLLIMVSGIELFELDIMIFHFFDPVMSCFKFDIYIEELHIELCPSMLNDYEVF